MMVSSVVRFCVDCIFSALIVSIGVLYSGVLLLDPSSYWPTMYSLSPTAESLLKIW